MLRGEIGERTHAARGIGRGRAQELGELVSGARIEAAIGAARESSNFAKGLVGDRIVALLEHESGHAQKPELAGGVTEIVELLLHRIADEHQGLYLGGLRLPPGMRDDLADLRVAATAVDPLHQPGERLGLRYPAR